MQSQLVATLIAHPARPVITPEFAAAAADALSSRSHYFLADGIACDIPFQGDGTKARDDLSAIIGDRPIDCVVQDSDTRRKKALIADMDSTMIEQECIDELASLAGVGAEVSKITARAMRGELDFDGSLHERVALLTGHPVSLIERVIDDRLSFTSGGAELVATMRANGAYCALVSGGFLPFTAHVAENLGFDEHRANTFSIRDGRFDGTVVPPILGPNAKVEALEQIAVRLGIDEADVMAVGDGANDLGMIARAGTGIALHAKPVVAQQARFRIDHADLTALLYMQGYRRADFVAP